MIHLEINSKPELLKVWSMDQSQCVDCLLRIPAETSTEKQRQALSNVCSNFTFATSGAPLDEEVWGPPDTYSQSWCELRSSYPGGQALVCNQ